MNNYKVSELYLYPIKSLGGISVNSAKVTDRGFEHDRRWMLVDSNNQFLSQRSLKGLSLLQTKISNDSLFVYNKLNPTEEIQISLYPPNDKINEVTVWDDTVLVNNYGNEINEWFSEQLKTNCKLVYMPDKSQRLVDPKYSNNNEITSLSDGYPFLIIGEESLTLLNSKLQNPLPMNRFRPNIVFTGGEPHDEDSWKKFSINDINFFPVKPCARCVITTIDQETAKQAEEPLKTLSTYRRAEDNKVLFGMNLIHEGKGVVTVGDKLNVQ